MKEVLDESAGLASMHHVSSADHTAYCVLSGALNMNTIKM